MNRSKVLNMYSNNSHFLGLLSFLSHLLLKNFQVQYCVHQITPYSCKFQKALRGKVKYVPFDLKWHFLYKNKKPQESFKAPTINVFKVCAA